MWWQTPGLIPSSISHLGSGVRMDNQGLCHSDRKMPERRAPQDDEPSMVRGRRSVPSLRRVITSLPSGSTTWPHCSQSSFHSTGYWVPRTTWSFQALGSKPGHRDEEEGSNYAKNKGMIWILVTLIIIITGTFSEHLIWSKSSTQQFQYMISFNSQKKAYKRETIVFLPFCWYRRLKEVNWFAQGHRSSKGLGEIWT